VSIAFVLAACAPSVAPQSPPSLATPTSAIAPLTAPTPTTMAPIMTKPFDPVAVGLTVDGVRAICDDHLALAKTILYEIRGKAGASADQLTYANTIGRFDDAVAEIDNASQFPYLMGVAHPDKAVRDAAKECEPKVEQVNTGLYLDAKLASVLKAYAAKGEKLEGERARLLSDTIRDFRRNGLELSADDQTKLRALNKEITDLGQQVNTNIASSTGHVALDPKQLEGLSPEYIAKHPAKDGKVSISTDYPDYFPFVTYAKDRKAALQLEVLFENRGGDENVKLLERLFSLRNDKAKLLGYATWADYQTEPRMAKSAATVATFLAHVRDAVREPAKREFAEMVQEHVALGGKATDAIPLSDRYYLEDKLRNKKYKFDSKELSAYFEVGSVTRGLLDVTAQMYGLEYKEVPAEAWHADVKAYEVHSDGKLIGKFYLDLYPRDGKYKHAAMFPIRPAKRLADGTYQTPEAGLECNFPRPAAPGEAPALMEHTDVVTFFHEFGHVLHHILTRSELATYSGTSTVQDFIEAPSQMFEEWAWNKDVLDRFAKHYATGAKIPDALFASMTKSRAFGRALFTQRQLFLASLDLEYHMRAPGFDSTKMVEEVMKQNSPFSYVPGTHFQGSFGHLVGGYDAGYYGYQWSLSLSRDVLTRFKSEGMLNPTTARAWRDAVLSKGGGEDERAQVAHFLGREPNEQAYIAFLKGQD
jgi:thimet oligopeptidase